MINIGLKNRDHFGVTCDSIIFGYGDKQLYTALIERKNEPFTGQWAIPGGFIKNHETIEEGARRELEEETGIRDIYMEQVHSFYSPGRDPRGPVLTVAFLGLVSFKSHKLKADADARKAQWWLVSALPQLAFDHQQILTLAHQSLKQRTTQLPVGLELLGPEFTLTEMQELYEAILGTKLDKRNFRKKMSKAPYLVDTKKQTSGSAHRPAKLFRYDQKQVLWEEKFLGV